MFEQWNYRYDEEGNEIYSKRSSYYPGNVINEEYERQRLSDQLESVRNNYVYPYGEYNYYI